ncbi:putative RNA recognition motif 2 domain protein [Gregarina niphandrodes]|uniref:RNA recognition motif 2 domain protein n=1 Tax=Gregarina niphandrodes TaxID=110365 RepID=A0A023B2U3_GRENI|nr:putative RNA recognition motif 2 domain protein [Gregarina niphandrodes]EZG55213.1 putative RNA recognition motif 2 domain protein [Gregarina niphandrodes]|eukprot:XP_011131708.1 putative RNA recognition motif 2 domain protein [Gregarina niphandrodes]
MLLEVIDADFQGLYNFFYLPIDFKNKCNVGYAFLNFIEPYYCDLFWKKFAGRRLTGFRSRKVCDVSWGRVQGLKSNIEHYRNSSIMSLPCQEYKPLLFKNGVIVPFPPPNSQQKHKQETPSTPN